MITFLLRRLLVTFATVLLAVILVFLAVRMLPGNPILARFGQHAVPEKIELEMQRQGWDKPLYAQLGDYLWGIVSRGDFGNSMLRPTNRVLDDLLKKFPATVELTIAALLIAIPLGIGAGIGAAVWRNRFPDYLCMSGSLLGVSIPVFFLGLCLIVISDRFLGGYFPIGRRLPITMRFDSTTGFYLCESFWRRDWTVFFAALRHITLPALALSTVPMAIIARITRSSMLDILYADYIRTARAKGGSNLRVVLRHALPNASIPIVNITGLQASLLLSGAVLTETVFGWPGLGSYLIRAVNDTDYTIIQGALLWIAAMFAVFNFLLDLVYAWLDPRICNMN